ncbi:MAG: hypothetical protein BWY07_00732 [Candidatus Hydrogenedentes bacterium ADurb.Bin170]|nr:MAG: hypothetical protein BWY07_00732 [Candidatus Hydrogenedentes bacterium ADurb.Bin170]
MIRIRQTTNMPFRTLLLSVGFFFLFASTLFFSYATPSTEEKPVKNILVCPVEGEIRDSVSVLVDRVVTEESKDAEAIVFTIDTFGGRVDSAIDIASSILKARVPTIAYVTGKGAISAGALIAYACDTIIMEPGVNIGASTPVMPGVEMSESMNEKSMSFLRAKYRALGEEKGHNPLIGEAMVDPRIELYYTKSGDGSVTVFKVEQGRVIEKYRSGSFSVLTASLSPGALIASAAPGFSQDSLKEVEKLFRGTHPSTDGFSGSSPQDKKPEPPAEKSHLPASSAPDLLPELPSDARLLSPAGNLLTLTAREAQEVALVTYLAYSVEQGLKQLGYTSFTSVAMKMTLPEKIFSFLTSPLIAGLLLLCGVAGIYIEIKTPGIGLPGLIGVVCLSLYFGSRLIFGLASWLDLLLVIVGIILIIAEIFFIPGFGVTGITGILCLFAGIYLSLMRVPIPTYSWDFDRLRDGGITLLVAGSLFIAFVVLTWKYFPRSSFARGLLLADAQFAEAGYTVQTREEQGAIGQIGITASMLRPAGKGRFGNKTLDIVTEGDFLDPGTPVEIILVEGNRYVVRQRADKESLHEQQ